MRFTDDQIGFILANYRGVSSKDLAEMVNREFGTEFTALQMHQFKQSRHLRSGAPAGIVKGSYSRKFPKPIADYIFRNHKGCGPKEMSERLNAEFGTEFTPNNLKSFYANHHLNSGLDGKFQKGHRPASYGKTQEEIIKDPEKLARVRSAWFQKGHESPTREPVGTERLRVCEGYWWRKVAEPNVWRMRSRLVWEEHNGPLPPNDIIIHLNGDKGDDRIENLALVSKYQHLVMTRRHLRFKDKDLTEVGVAIAGLEEARNRREKSEGKSEGSGSRALRAD